jgi:UDP-N-acetyl-D-mannosaminuronic acid dehydrogenase
MREGVTVDDDPEGPLTRAYRAPASDEVFRRGFRDGDLTVAVYGLGKMGLPLAAVYADVTGTVVGADVDEAVVDAIEAGDCPVENEPGLPALVSDLVADDALRATGDPAAAATAADVHVLVVPTLVEDGDPDLSLLEAAVDDVASGLAPGDLVVVESTVPPRTCRDVVEPTLADASGLDHDAFGVAFCPERTASGRALEDIRGAYPKVVGGTDDAATTAATRIYRELNSEGVLPVADATTAEAVKVFEGVYRDVNIALANELATYADDLAIDVREAIATANTQPYCDIHDPGPGVGGHCIPYYPYFLFGEYDHESPLLRTAREVNDRMPAVAVGKLVDLLARQGVAPEDATVGVLGVTYRPDVKETRASPAIDVAEVLADLGARPLGVDPLLDDWSDLPLEPVALDDLAEADLDGVVLVTPHDAFDDLDWAALGGPLAVVDGRDALDDDALPRDDQRCHTIGSGTDSGV